MLATFMDLFDLGKHVLFLLIIIKKNFTFTISRTIIVNKMDIKKRIDTFNTDNNVLPSLYT